ncbi:AraC family transcriptional regulator [Thalassotalea sp. 1_MG-2023]|uniref:AraC family transcriptional regulator n=1 Tax=Thalassotalea sp. 1_MG-2023 TaxID=3062680 RepID=UPI0026E299A2|nr:AraC family transcriptional regulator [Thalassotalea sp. 1_MG-2023]MDO6425861.1 AraC family transcriptional regulator [Thalassotalea sp. 1_MG-2023]
MIWSQRMNLAIDYIESNLDSALSTEDVAKVACCSKYHFHRMFFANFKVTCAEYIRRRKLTMAAVELLNTNESIVDIAFKYGYESPNAFTRAFRNMHGINPSKARLGGTSLSSYKRVFFSKDKKVGVSMNYKIIEIPEFNIIGKSKSFEFEDFVKDGPKFWKEYIGSEDYKKLYQLNNGRPCSITNSSLLSAYFPKENGKRDEFTDVLGVEATSEDSLSGFEVYTVPSSTYAEFNCTYKTSMKTNRYIYGEWFSSTGYERDGNKPDIVAYFPIPFRPMNEMCIRWWIPVIRKQ